MAKKKSKSAKKAGAVNRSGKGGMVAAVVGALLVGIYLGGVVVPAFKDSAEPHSSSGSAQTTGQQIEQAQKMAESQPDSWKVWANLGNLYYDNDEHAKAIEAYKKALAIEPHEPHVLTDLGVMYRRNGNPKKAVETFDLAIIAAPDHETARFNKGIVLYYDIKDKEGALKAWKGLVDLNPQAKTPGGKLVRDMINELR